MECGLKFKGVQFEIVGRNGEPWPGVYQIGSALGYERPDVSIPQFFNRHADELTRSMTALVKLPTEGGEQEVRIFSLRGCHLLALFARTPVAKEFRKWVLDVLARPGKAERRGKRELETDMLPALGQKIIQTLVKNIADRYQGIDQRSVNMRLWEGLRNHFGIASCKHLQSERLTEA